MLLFNRFGVRNWFQTAIVEKDIDARNRGMGSVKYWAISPRKKVCYPATYWSAFFSEFEIDSHKLNSNISLACPALEIHFDLLIDNDGLLITYERQFGYLSKVNKLVETHSLRHHFKLDISLMKSVDDSCVFECVSSCHHSSSVNWEKKAFDDICETMPCQQNECECDWTSAELGVFQ